jgi:hypothetical protein
VVYQWKFKREQHDNKAINAMVTKAEKEARAILDRLPRSMGQGTSLCNSGPTLRPLRLSVGHVTMMLRERGLVRECHRHCLGSAVSLCSAIKGSYIPCLTRVSDLRR